MILITKVAAYIVQKYKELMGEDIDEMKLHKLLYFAQRESYAVNDSPLFKGSFVAAPFGPLSVAVRTAYKKGKLLRQDAVPADFVEENKKVFDRIWSYYALRTSWSLSMMSHCEISWKNANDQTRDAHHYGELKEEDIRLDALRIRRRREGADVLN